MLLLPVTAFIRLRISAPEPIRLFYLLEAFVSERPFARPQRLFSFENHRGEVKAPDLSLRRNSELFFRLVRPCAPTLDDVYHATGDVRRTKQNQSPVFSRRFARATCHRHRIRSTINATIAGGRRGVSPVASWIVPSGSQSSVGTEPRFPPFLEENGCRLDQFTQRL
jgi:hypothetical protein